MNEKAPKKPKAKKAATPVVLPENPKPTQEQIARRAYEIWLARGGGDGHDQNDWQQAEHELNGQSS